MAFIIQGSDGTQKKIAGLGAPGKSAYQYAVDGGYEGTEEEFASLLSNVQAKISGTTG